MHHHKIKTLSQKQYHLASGITSQKQTLLDKLTIYSVITSQNTTAKKTCNDG